MAEEPKDPEYMKIQNAVNLVLKEFDKLVKDNEDLTAAAATLKTNLDKPLKTYFKDLEKDLKGKDDYKNKGDLQVEFGEVQAASAAKKMVDKLGVASVLDFLEVDKQREAFAAITSDIEHNLAFKKKDETVTVKPADIAEKHGAKAMRSISAPAEATIEGKGTFISELYSEIKSYTSLEEDNARENLADIVQGGVDGRKSAQDLLEKVDGDFKIKENDMLAMRNLVDLTMKAKKPKFSPEIDTKISVAAAMIKHGLEADKQEAALNEVKEAVKAEVKGLESFKDLNDEKFNKKFDKDFKSVAESKHVKNLPQNITKTGFVGRADEKVKNFADNKPKIATGLGVVVTLLAGTWLGKMLFGKKKDAQALDDGQQPEPEEKTWQQRVGKGAKIALAVGAAAGGVYLASQGIKSGRNNGWSRS
jgi:hypothetical protein